MFNGKEIHIFLVRHAESEANKMKIVCGQLDSPLTEEGKEQALKLANSLKANNIEWDHCYSSPLTRSTETARIITSNSFFQVCPELIEINAGDYSHMQISDLNRLDPRFQLGHGVVSELAYPNGESLAELNRRTINWLEKNVLEKGGGRHLIVAHWGGINSILQHLFKIHISQYSSFYLYNCHLTHVVVNPGAVQNVQMHRFNFI